MIEILAAYFLADFGAALFHLATDRGYNLERICRNFQNHHDHPEKMTFDLEPMLAGLPIMCIGFFALPWFFVSLGLFICLAQIPHYYAHHPAPCAIVALQECGMILHPDDHDSHHTEPFDKDFCVISGWSNPLVNWLIKKGL